MIFDEACKAIEDRASSDGPFDTKEIDTLSFDINEKFPYTWLSYQFDSDTSEITEFTSCKATILHIAILALNVKAVEFLLVKGADISIKFESGETTRERRDSFSRELSKSLVKTSTEKLSVYDVLAINERENSWDEKETARKQIRKILENHEKALGSLAKRNIAVYNSISLLAPLIDLIAHYDLSSASRIFDVKDEKEKNYHANVEKKLQEPSDRTSSAAENLTLSAKPRTFCDLIAENNSIANAAAMEIDKEEEKLATAHKRKSHPPQDNTPKDNNAMKDVDGEKERGKAEKEEVNASPAKRQKTSSSSYASGG